MARTSPLVQIDHVSGFGRWTLYRRRTAGRYPTLAALATDCGYADQAHFNRDFSAFAGETPANLKADILLDGTGVMASGW
jgi:AraC-like DNA-binding protein